MTAGIIQRIEENIQMAQKAADEMRLYGSIGNGFSLGKRGYISRGELDKSFEPMFRYLRRLRDRGTWPRGSIKDGYYSSSTHDLTYHSTNREIGLFPYSISKALGNVDDAIILRNKGSVSATEALIKVFHSKELLDVNSIHQMWFVVVKVFPNKIDGFLQDFVKVIFKKFAETPYDFEVYRAAASLVKGFSSSIKYSDSEIAQSLSRISEDIMRLGHIVNGREIAEGSLNVISPFRVVASGRGVGIAYSDEWIKNTSRMIDEAATTGSLSDFSLSLSSAFKRAREFGNKFVGDENLAKKVIFDFKDAILKGGELKDEVVTTYFRWILNDRKILSISDGEVAKIIAEIIESKNLFHLMDDPEISRVLDEVPAIMESIAKLL